MPVKPSKLNPLGVLIEKKGLALAHVIEQSGIPRHRLAALRTVPTAVITLTEGAALAPVMGMNMEELVAALEKIGADPQEPQTRQPSPQE